MQRDRGWCAGAANTRLAGAIISCVAMLEDPDDEHRVGDRGDDTHLPTAAWTVAQVNREHRAQTLHPAHRGRGPGFHGFARGTVPVGRRRLGGVYDNVVAMLRIWSKESMVTHQMSPRTRHQSGEASNKVQRLEQYVSGAVAERVFQFIDH